MPKVKIGTAYGVTVELEANEVSYTELRKEAMNAFREAHAVIHARDRETTGFAAPPPTEKDRP